MLRCCGRGGVEWLGCDRAAFRFPRRTCLEVGRSIVQVKPAASNPKPLTPC